MSSPNQLSFLPEDYLETKRQRRTNIICAVLFVLIMSGIGVAFTSMERSLGAAKKEHDDVAKQYAEAATRIEQERQMQEKQLKMNNQAELTASLLEKVPRSVLLAELTNAKPAGVSFLDLVLDSKLRSGGGGGGGGKSQFELKRAAMEAANGSSGKPAAGAPQAKLYDVTVKVTGICENDIQVSQFMAKLNHSKVLREVNLLVSEEFNVAEVKMRKFQMEMMIDPAAEVSPGAAKARNANAAVELQQ